MLVRHLLASIECMLPISGAGMANLGIRGLDAKALSKLKARAPEHGAALVTRDAHFSHIDGLRCGQRLGDFLP